MIIPSIDLMDGQTVQLVRGEEKALDAGDPIPIARRFGRVGEIAVIDLDAALGQGSNSALVEQVVNQTACRVGGGIRDYGAAARWLDAGAAKIILGTAAREDLLKRLPRDRVIAALDARNGEVVTHGWTAPTGRGVVERMHELRSFVSGFLVTFVEVEGTMSGLGAERAAPLVEAAGDARITVAGGVKSADEIGALDAIGVDAQVGMALYTGRFTLADAVAACLRSDRPDGLWSTVVTDERGSALGLTYSSRQSLNHAIEHGVGAYQSRQRGLWIKGAVSGAAQELLKIDLDCDRDALRFTVRQAGPGFCHLGTRSCWGHDRGLAGLAQRLERIRNDAAPDGSYTARLFSDQTLLESKIQEEAAELCRASGAAQTIHEAADVLYFTLACLAARDVTLEQVERELDRRSLKVSRRGGDAKK